MIVPAVIFWLCVVAMLHTYVTYPLSLRLFRRRYAVPPAMPDGAWPTVSILIPAYNEEKVIGAKIENLLALDYDPGKMEILVGSDGSTDRTDEIVRGYSDARIKLIRLAGRSGKPGVLNELVNHAAGDIMVLTDANVIMRPDTFRHLIRHFHDSQVAGVIAVKEIRTSTATESEQAYAAFSSWIKNLEASVGGFSGAYGSYYALRRKWFPPLPLVAMNDDILTLCPAIKAGCRVAFEPSAVGYEDAATTLHDEFHRRTRIGASNFRTLHFCRGLFWPPFRVVAYTFFSHKILRWYFPFFMLGALVSNAFLLRLPTYQLTGLVQATGYTFAVLGGFGAALNLRLPVLYKSFYFLALNIALLIGWFANCLNTRKAIWERTAREERMKDEG
jgi:cellulose synthase/poly-beta-1,6-N-acetylglucosamine synthase-like glycosyltransferase